MILIYRNNDQVQRKYGRVRESADHGDLQRKIGSRRSLMPVLFLMAAATAVLTYRLLWTVLERRDAALAVRRLSTRTAGKEDVERGRPRLIEGVGEARGGGTARLLEGLRLRDAAED